MLPVGIELMFQKNERRHTSHPSDHPDSSEVAVYPHTRKHDNNACITVHRGIKVSQ